LFAFGRPITFFLSHLFTLFHIQSSALARPSHHSFLFYFLLSFFFQLFFLPFGSSSINMVCVTKVAIIFIIGLVGIYARPEPEPVYPNSISHQEQESGGADHQSSSTSQSQSQTQSHFNRNSENAVLCRPSELSDGSINYDCDSVGGSGPDLTIKSQHVLHLNGAEGKDRNLYVNVPNYRIDGLIQAAQGKGGGLSNTNINVILQKPVITYEAQQQEGLRDAEEKFNVNFEYEKLDGQTVHFSDDSSSGSQRYSPLSGNIAEPGFRGSSGASSSFGSLSGNQGGSRISRGLAPQPKYRAPIKLVRIY
jgi:hypothetical protein